MAFYKCVPIRKAEPPAVLPLYPLEDGTFSHTLYTITTSATGHVYLKNNSGNAFRSIYRPSYADSVNNRPEWFSLNRGDEVNLKFKNTHLEISGAENTFYTAFNFRKANSNSSSAYLSTKEFLANTFRDGFDKTFTMGADEHFGAYFAYFNYPCACELEFDIEMWVNGIRYI